MEKFKLTKQSKLKLCLKFRGITILAGIILIFSFNAKAFEYPVKIKVLSNGLKVIVCEKPGNGFVQSEIWYRVGSKDETPGNRGLAHMFEHMMFKGSKKYPTSLIDKMQDIGISNFNAYTSFDRTVYYEYAPLNFLDTVFSIEADRMENLIISQEMLNTERQVVAEEYSNGRNNWYQKMNEDRYKFLYPEGHPYQVDVIGEFNDIVNFTAAQCQKYYDNFYSPNNAFMIVVGDVQSDKIFGLAEKYFGPIKKQLDIKPKTNIPDLFTNKVKQNEMGIDFPIQIYSFIIPCPDAGAADSKAFEILISSLFTSQNSILNERIVNKERLAYGINSSGAEQMSYSNYINVDVFMSPMPGNIKVKKEIRDEINKVIANGIDQSKIDQYVRAIESGNILNSYEPNSVAYRLGAAEFFYHDPLEADKDIEGYKKISPEDIKAVAAKYLSEEQLQFINIKPSF
jgi:zinc protease